MGKDALKTSVRRCVSLALICMVSFAKATPEKDAACLGLVTGLAAGSELDVDCQGFLEAFKADECPIAEAKKDLCWKRYSATYENVIKNCADRIFSGGESKKVARSQFTDNPCYTPEQLSVLGKAFDYWEANSAFGLGVPLFLAYILPVFVFILPLF